MSSGIPGHTHTYRPPGQGVRADHQDKGYVQTTRTGGTCRPLGQGVRADHQDRGYVQTTRTGGTCRPVSSISDLINVRNNSKGLFIVTNGIHISTKQEEYSIQPQLFSQLQLHPQ